jgi:mRNA-degrading endonuclease RelE of RelBE toxin-antitoxin system
MKHRTHSSFWQHYRQLPKEIQEVANKNFNLLKADPRHASVRLKKVSDGLWSARVGLHYRALATDDTDGSLLWFWIGHHSEYDRMIS